MDPSHIRSYLQRDWGTVRALKDRHWAKTKKKLEPEEALAIGDLLRRHVQTLRPDWPDAEQRSEDLAAHIRLSALLRRVPSPHSR